MFAIKKKEYPEHMPHEGTAPEAPGRNGTLLRLCDSRNCAWNGTTSGRNGTSPRLRRLPVQEMEKEKRNKEPVL